MRIVLAGAAMAVAISLIGIASVQAQPRNLHAYCAAHPNAPGRGELSEAQLPPALRGDGAMAWRCMDGRVLVCALGATGEACEHTVPIDAARMRTFRQYCRRNPGQIIPNALGHHLASAWRCDGVHPLVEQTITVDRAGYSRDSWRRLP